MTLVEENLQHLLSLRPNAGPKNPKRCLSLARSFLTLEILWARAIGAADEYPCIDLAGHLGHSNLPKSIEIPFRESYFSQSTAESRACLNYLRWSCLKTCDPEKSLLADLPDPFIPLVELFEAGGSFSIEPPFFDVHNCGGLNMRALRMKMKNTSL